MMAMEEQADAGVDELLAALGYKVRPSDMADIAQKLEQLEMAMGGSAAPDDALLTHLFGVDEVLAALGYKVRSSDMADIAQKLEQLEMAMGGGAAPDDALLTHLAADTVHYIPSGYFAEALARRIYRIQRQQVRSLDSAFADVLKLAHFTANQAILEAFAGCSRVHVIDFGMKQGMQWPALMQALALRPGGPPFFRLTGIGPPQADNSDSLQYVGWRLAQLAKAIHINFEYKGFVASSLADLEPYVLESPPPPAGEEPDAVAVNSVFELHRLLARPGALDKVLSTVHAVRPRIVTLVEQEANHNAGQFTERHETLVQWRGRMARAGFDPVHLGSNAFKQASTLLALFARGDGYRVEEKEGCLTLGWHTRPLIAASAWCASAADYPAPATWPHQRSGL